MYERENWQVVRAMKERKSLAFIMIFLSRICSSLLCKLVSTYWPSEILKDSSVWWVWPLKKSEKRKEIVALRWYNIWQGSHRLPSSACLNEDWKCSPMYSTASAMDVWDVRRVKQINQYELLQTFMWTIIVYLIFCIIHVFAHFSVWLESAWQVIYMGLILVSLAKQN